jgi:hypothetical protein
LRKCSTVPMDQDTDHTPALLFRAGCLGIGLLSGGYGKEELEQVGAYRVYLDRPTCWPTSMKLASELWTRWRKG